MAYFFRLIFLIFLFSSTSVIAALSPEVQYRPESPCPWGGQSFPVTWTSSKSAACSQVPSSCPAAQCPKPYCSGSKASVSYSEGSCNAYNNDGTFIGSISLQIQRGACPANSTKSSSGDSCSCKGTSKNHRFHPVPGGVCWQFSSLPIF